MGAKAIDDDLFEELETQLLMADIGVEATAAIMAELTETVARKDLQDPQKSRENSKCLKKNVCLLVICKSLI